MLAKIILGSIVLGLISAPISIIKKPRFFWGSAAFDPISFPWMISFFLYGPLGAFISSLIGASAIALFSKEATPVLGAMLKCTGTATVWLTIYLLVLYRSDTSPRAIYCYDLTVYIPAMLLAAILRCLVEIPACYFAIPYFLSRSTKTPVSSHMMLAKFGGLKKYFLLMIALNFYLSFLDALIPWLLVYPTGVYAKFAVW